MLFMGGDMTNSPPLTSKQYAKELREAGIKCLKEGNFKASIICFVSYWQISIESEEGGLKFSGPKVAIPVVYDVD